MEGKLLYQMKNKMIDNNRKDIIDNYLDTFNHDVRTLVSSILGLSVIGENEVNNPEKTGECFSSIRNTAKSLLECIDGNMTKMREQLGDVRGREELFNLTQLSNIIKEYTKDSNIDGWLDVEYDNETDYEEYLIGDLHRIKYVIYQVFDEIFTRHAQKIRVKLSANKMCAKNNRIINIVFYDDGIDSLTEEKDSYSYEIARGFVNKMNGSMERSMKDNINILTLSLLLNSQDTFSKSCEKENTEEKKNEINCDEFAGVRILLVEDNELNAKITKEVIELHGACVDWAINGYDAIKLITKEREESYDLILMDLQMPDIDGFETTRAIRNLNMNYTKRIPILALTANVLIGSIQEALAVGMDNYIVKPVEINDLRHIIKKYVKNENL